MAEELEMDDAAPNSDGDGLGAIACTELFHDVLDMPLDRFLGDKKERGDVAVSISSGDLLKDLYFTITQRLITEMFGKLGRNLRGNVFFSGMHLADGVDELLSRHALEQVCLGPGLERALDLGISFKGREHNHARIGELGTYGDHCIDPANVRQPEVHERDVGPVLTKALDSLLPGGSLRNQQHVGLISD